MKSLRNRAVAGGAIWATVVMLAGTNAVGNYLESLSLSRFDEFLAARHSQTVVALANSGGDSDAMLRRLTDPIYERPFSGSYWQAVREDGQIIASRSMTDYLIGLDPPLEGQPAIADVDGPAGQTLRALAQKVTIDDGSTWIVTVASSTAPIAADQAELRRRLNLSFALIGVLATLGAFAIVLFTLRPLSQLRKDVIARDDHEGALPVENYPLEVQPLVTEINNLLDRNRDVINRSRRQTVDLAHALKTPSAVLRNELFALLEDGIEVQGGLRALDRLDAQLKRSFARMKASQSSALEREVTSIDVSLPRLARAFSALAKNADRNLVLEVPQGLFAKINQIDMEEIVGNLLDNALKWSQTALTLRAEAVGDWVQISVEDDGPGIPKSDEDRAFASGQRLDESKPGTGLGLAIAADLVAAYQGRIEIGQSPRLGGAKVVVLLRRAVQAGGRS